MNVFVSANGLAHMGVLSWYLDFAAPCTHARRHLQDQQPGEGTRGGG